VSGPARAVLVAFVALGSLSVAARAEDAGSFEALAREAPAVGDLGMLLAPFVDDCRRSPGELERVRCLAVRASLRARLPGQTFAFLRDADAIVASPWDPRARAVRLTVAGCLSCKELVDAGAGERRYVTVKAPSRGPSGGPVAAELLRTAVPLANPAEAERWLKTTLPRLRVELLFRPADEPWTIGASRGHAFALVGVRVYDRCTGEVLASQPPSRGPAPQENPCAAPETNEGAGDR
jgi:hypothetical protein